MKYKITYLDYMGKALGLIITVGWFSELPNKIINHGIIDKDIIKIERIFEADANDILDLSNQ